ncbi:hypothetical protein BASA50_005827 [Batrachochytrium salamandrivorans]|uniref:HTH psq-type domain-containing protein n=1 Tax=Batrachochytrium salamandrivorans TaxID=1357716 RepID=A0ABQ8FBK3_9FUNG|nr:hypothetical protein BASA50_005827 [Batrachochytrium salamandrivorans]
MSIVEPEKKKQKLVDLSTKLAILKYLDDNHSIRATADKFKLSKGTIQSVKQNGEPLSKEAESNRKKPTKSQLRFGVDVGGFLASKDWSQKWKQRNNVQSYKINGESGNVDLVGAEQWKSSLTTMFTGYDLRIVFNMNETGVFF